MLGALQTRGLRNLVLCPGSRSAPIAIAAGYFARSGHLSIKTAIDERSAAFLALGLSTSTGIASAVVTTSGSAVANLLPAAIEADRSCQPLIFLTADRPSRLKECGANQTVNQEEFLKPVCRWVSEGPKAGLHLFKLEEIYDFVLEAWNRAHQFAGPVQLNIPLEEPLFTTFEEQEELWRTWKDCQNDLFKKDFGIDKSLQGDFECDISLDPSSPGVIIVGPWRGLSENLFAFQQALRNWQDISGWPVLADPLACVPGSQKGLIQSWELLLPEHLPIPKEGLQVMRLGPMTASRNLEQWLRRLGKHQLLITEGDVRKLDPLGIAMQWSSGLADWLEIRKRSTENCFGSSQNGESELLNKWKRIEIEATAWLDNQLPSHGAINEASLARCISRLLPTNTSIMLAASSPVRDWLAFSDLSVGLRCFGFRGASGIDGTLSLAVGLSIAQGTTVLVTGDLALLHDTNGWLIANVQRPPLVVLLIDNGGGGIFSQLKLVTAPLREFEHLFAMPQRVDPLTLADAYSIPNRQIASLEDLELGMEWALAQNEPVLLRVCTDCKKDAILRNELRNELSKHLQMTFKNGFMED